MDSLQAMRVETWASGTHRFSGSEDFCLYSSAERSGDAVVPGEMDGGVGRVHLNLEPLGIAHRLAQGAGGQELEGRRETG